MTEDAAAPARLARLSAQIRATEREALEFTNRSVGKLRKGLTGSMWVSFAPCAAIAG